MLSSKNVRGFLAVLVVAFMVSTAVIPAVNVSAASGEDDVLAVPVREGPDASEGTPVDLGGTDGIASILSALTGGADLSGIIDLIRGQDLGGLLEEFASADPEAVLSATLSRILTPGTDTVPLMELIQDAVSLFDRAGDLAGYLTPESRTIHIPDIRYGPFELKEVTITFVFEEGELMSVSVSAESVSVDAEGEVYCALGNVSVSFYAGGLVARLGYIVFGDDRIELDTEVVLGPAGEGEEVSVSLFDGLIRISVIVTEDASGISRDVDVFIREFQVPLDSGEADLEGISFHYRSGPAGTRMGAHVNSAACGGEDITDEVNSAIDGFFASSSQASDIFSYEELNMGPVEFTRVDLYFGKHDDGFTVHFGGQGSSFMIGESVSGTILQTSVTIKGADVKFSCSMGGFMIDDEDSDFMAEFSGPTVILNNEGDDHFFVFAVKAVETVSKDGTVRTSSGDKDHMALLFRYTDTPVNTVLVIDRDLTTVKVSGSEEAEWTVTGFRINGSYTDSSRDGSTGTKAELTVRTFDDHSGGYTAYLKVVYTGGGGYYSVDADYAVYLDPVSVVGATAVTWGGITNSETELGIGIGRAVELGGREFLCFYPTLEYDGDLDYGFTVRYQFRDGLQKEAVWDMRLSEKGGSTLLVVDAKDLIYCTPNGEPYLKVARAELSLDLSGSGTDTMLTLKDVALGQETSMWDARILKADTVVVRTSVDAFNGSRATVILMTGIYLSDVKVSDTFSYTIAADRDGRIIWSFASGDLDLNFGESGLEFFEGYYLYGRASITDGEFVQDIRAVIDSDPQKVIGWMTVGNGEVVLKLKMTDVEFGPFVNFECDIEYGVPKPVRSFSQGQVIFGQNVSYVTEGMTDVHIDWNSSGFGGLAFGADDEGGAVLRAGGLSFVMEDGYELALASSEVRIGGDTFDAAAQFGTEDCDALNIRVFVSEDRGFREISVGLGNAFCYVTADDMNLRISADGPDGTCARFSSVASVYGEDVMRSITDLDLGVTVEVSSEPVAAASVNGLTYVESPLREDPLIHITRAVVLDSEMQVTVNGLSSVEEVHYTYTVDSIVSTGFNDGILATYSPVAGAPSVMIDASSEEMTVIRIAGIDLEEQEDPRYNSLDAEDIVITIAGTDIDLDVGYMNAVFTEFYFAPTGSTLNGIISYDSQNPGETAVHLRIDRITDLLGMDAVLTGITLDISYAQGREVENKFSFTSFRDASGDDATIIMGASSFDILNESYSVGRIELRGFEAVIGTYTGYVEKIAYSQSESPLLPVPMFSFDLGGTDISDGSGNRIVSDGFLAVFHATSTYTNPALSLRIDGNIGISTPDAYADVRIDDFTAVAKTSSDRMYFDLSASQKEASLTVGTPDGTAVTIDTSKDVLAGKMEIRDGTIGISATVRHDDVLEIRGPEGSMKVEQIGTGTMSISLPSDGDISAGFDFGYGFVLGDMAVTVDGDAARVSITDVSFSLAVSGFDGDCSASLDGTAWFSVDGDGYGFNARGVRVHAELGYGPEGVSDLRIDMHADEIGLSSGGVAMEIDGISVDGPLVTADEVEISSAEDDVEVEFGSVYILGGLFYAGSMSGTVAGFDVLDLEYDPQKGPGDRLFAYRGVFYFSLFDGIRTFTNSQPVEPPTEECIIIYVPDVEMTFTDGGAADSYSVPVNSKVALDGYYDVTPVPGSEYGIPVTTDLYTVQECDVELRHSETVDRLIDSHGVVCLTYGSGIVFDSDALSRIDVPVVTVITPQHIVMRISLDSLRMLASDCGTTMLGITAGPAADHAVELRSILRTLSTEDLVRALDGTLVSVDTGKSVHTAGLGEVTISLPLDVAPGELPEILSYHVGSAGLRYDGRCDLEVFDDKVYAAFTVSHFSDFLLCEKLGGQPSGFTAQWIVLIALTVAAAGILVQLRRQNTL